MGQRKRSPLTLGRKGPGPGSLYGMSAEGSEPATDQPVSLDTCLSPLFRPPPIPVHSASKTSLATVQLSLFPLLLTQPKPLSSPTKDDGGSPPLATSLQPYTSPSPKHYPLSFLPGTCIEPLQ